MKKKLFNILIRTVFLLVIMFLLFSIILIIVDGSFLKKKYAAPWEKSYSDRFEDPRLKVIAYGMLAPNIYNIQPWKIVLDKEDKNQFQLFVDNNRLLPISDPFSRQITISQGTFLENVRYAATKFGYQAYITFFPKGEYNSSGTPAEFDKYPVATVKLVEANAETFWLFDAITRATQKHKVKRDKIPPDDFQLIFDLNKDPVLIIGLLSEPQAVANIKTLAYDAMKIDLEHSIKYDEDKLLRKNEWQMNKFRDGLSLNRYGLSRIKQIYIQAIRTLFPLDPSTAIKVRLEQFRSTILDAPYALIISTNGNSRFIQLKTGMLYCRIVHALSLRGISVQPMNQALQEYHEMTKLYRKAHNNYAETGNTLQMIALVGKVENNDILFSPRRDVMDLIVDEIIIPDENNMEGEDDKNISQDSIVRE